MSGLVSRLDPAAIGLGAVTTMAIGIPVATVGSVVLDDDSNFVFFFAVVALIGFLLGGMVAGSRSTDTPMTHGAIAALIGFVVAQAVSAILQVVRDEDISPVAIVFNGLLAANIGLAGGWFASRSQGRS